VKNNIIKNDMTLKQIQMKVKKCDEKSYFVLDKMYSELSDNEILNHNCFHLVKAVGKLANYLEKREHNINVEKEKNIVINEVIPDLIMYAVQFSNRFHVDLDYLIDKRIKETIEKYDINDLPRK